MHVGDEDGHGHYGVLNEDAEGLLCHEFGRRFAHLGLHAYKAHGLTAKAYRTAHGLGRRGLVAEAPRRTITQNARKQLTSNSAFVQNRDPAKATAVRLAAGSVFSPAGLEAMRQAPSPWPTTAAHRRRAAAPVGRVRMVPRVPGAAWLTRWSRRT